MGGCSSGSAVHLLFHAPATGLTAEWDVHCTQAALAPGIQLSAQKRAGKLLSVPGLGDGSAVDLMDDMLSLLGSDEGGFLLLQIFLHRLPPLELPGELSVLDCWPFGLAKEADCVLLTSRPFSIYEVALVNRRSCFGSLPVKQFLVDSGSQKSLLTPVPVIQRQRPTAECC